MLVRRYSNLIINLTKIISVKQEENFLIFVFPLSNYFCRNIIQTDENSAKRIEFKTFKTATEELLSIQKELEDYYKESKTNKML